MSTSAHMRSNDNPNMNLNSLGSSSWPTLNLQASVLRGSPMVWLNLLANSNLRVDICTNQVLGCKM